MTPEEKARIIIDNQLSDAGWLVINRDEYTPSAHACAVREGLMNLHGANLEADYLLFIEGKAVGVVEAKRAENPLGEDVQLQALNYTKNLPKWCAAWYMPLPIAILANSKTIYFYNQQSDMEDFVEIDKMPTPKELSKQLNLTSIFAGLPTLNPKGLRQCQINAIHGLEDSFRNGQKRALMILATGAGKTYTACLAAYRFLSYTPMRRVLFLVDRNNLGKQAEGEFGTFRLTETKEPFNTIFGVSRLKSKNIPADSNVIISTIQRLFSVLKGEDINDMDEESDFEDTSSAPVVLPTNPNLPPDYFDLIIVDECHRSIYGSWKQVLDYFQPARIIGLTATPVPETVAFFNKNIVVNYTLEQSIRDGVNVDHRTFRIRTEVTENGGAILQGQQTEQTTVYTGQVENVVWQENKNYTREELNRSIINPAQIKLILQTYKDSVYTQMFTLSVNPILIICPRHSSLH